MVEAEQDNKDQDEGPPSKSYYKGPVEEKIPSVNLYEILNESADSFKSFPAIIFYGKRITYFMLRSMVDSFAESLRSNFSISKGDHVAIVLPNCPQYVISFFALMKIGAVAVQINSTNSPREMKREFEHSRVKGIITLDSLFDKVRSASEKDVFIIVSRLQDFLPFGSAISRSIRKGSLASRSLEWSELVVKFSSMIFDHFGKTEPIDPEHDAAMMQFTGGTTGTFKAAMLSHGNLLSNAVAIKRWLPATDKRISVISVMPFFHIYGLLCGLVVPIFVGGTMILLLDIDNAGDILDSLEKFQPDYIFGTPTMFSSIIHSSEFGKEAFRHLKLAISGGDKLPESLHKTFEEKTGVTMVEGYGMTETTGITHIDPPDKNKRRIGSLGQPIANTEAMIVDESAQEPVGIGEIGELLIKGPQVMTGYWRDEAETAEIMKDGWLCTGDLVKMDQDGFFYIVDRKKDIIISRGFVIFPSEIEEALYLNENIAEAAAVGIPDESLGEAIKVFIAPKPQKAVSEKELKALCKTQLADYKRPLYYEFRNELPKNMAGKIIRRILKEEELKKRGKPKE